MISADELEKSYFVREFDVDRDYPLLSEWWRSREMEPVPLSLMPKLGVVACEEENGDPLAAAWLLMDNSVGVAFMEWLVAKPGLKPSQSRRAFHAITDYLQLAAADMGYHIFTGLCCPALAREAVKQGWQIIRNKVVTIAKGDIYGHRS